MWWRVERGYWGTVNNVVHNGVSGGIASTSAPLLKTIRN
jgi:hypothetical protein